MSWGRSSAVETKERKRKRIDCSDDSDEDFVVDEDEDNEDDDYANNVDAEDDDDGGLRGSDESDAKAKPKKPRRKSSLRGIRRRRRRRGVSKQEDDEEDEEFYLGSEYSTEEDEEEFIVVEKTLVKRKVRGVRRKKSRKKASSERRKTVPWSGVAKNRKRRARRAIKPEDGGRKTKLSPGSVKKRARRTREPEPLLYSDSDSDFVVSDAEINWLGGVPVARTLETRSRSSCESRRCQGARNSGHPLQKGLRLKLAEKADEAEDKGKEKLPNLCMQVCGICLSEEQKGTVRGRLNCCNHFFCFACIMEWSKVESRCPMCKQRFVSIDKSSRSGSSLRNESVRVPRRNQVYQPSEEELRSYLDPYANIVCMECHQGGDGNLMLLCDICDSCAHTYCVGLGREVPEGNWYCEACKASDPGALNLQADQVSVPDQFADSGLCSEESGFDTSMPFNSMSECLMTSPSHSSGQRSDLFPQSPFCGDSRIRSQVSGTLGASTVMGWLRLRHQIHTLLTNNGMEQTLDSADVANESLNVIIESDAVKSEVEQDGGEREHPGHLERNNLSDHLDDDRGRYGSFSVRCSFGESSTRQLQHGDFCPIEDLSLGGHETHCPVSSIADNAGGGNVPSNEPKVVPSQAVYAEVVHSMQTVPVVGSSDERNSSQLHDVKQQLCSLVKHHVKSSARDTRIERCEFKEIARRSTHTVLAAYGFKHSSSLAMVVQRPSCCHTRDGFGLGNLAKDCCSKCFNTFVGGVVQKIMKKVLKS